MAEKSKTKESMLVFLSHSSIDKPIARRIQAELEKRNIKTWLDEAEIRVGQSIPAEISRAIGDAEVLCLMISRASSVSGWVERELNSFIPRWINGKAALVPCRLDETALPTLISDVKYADFSCEFNDGLGQLLGAVRIREEIVFSDELNAARLVVLKKSNPPDVAFFVHHFSRQSHYMISDTRETRWPSVLGVLEEVGALDLTADRYERLYYLTEKGRHLLKTMEVDAPSELLARWDKEIGRRRK